MTVPMMGEVCRPGPRTYMQEVIMTSLLGCADHSGRLPQASIFIGRLVPGSASGAIPGEAWSDVTWLDVAVTSSTLPGWREALPKS